MLQKVNSASPLAGYLAVREGVLPQLLGSGIDDNETLQVRESAFGTRADDPLNIGQDERHLGLEGSKLDYRCGDSPITGNFAAYFFAAQQSTDTAICSKNHSYHGLGGIG
jgi:hypothetical protein